MPSQPQIEKAIQSEVQSQGLTGAIVLVKKGGEIIHHTAHGIDSTAQQELAPDTIYWFASMTKPIIATAAMICVEESKLSLDDEASKHIPSFSKPRLVRTMRADSPPLPPFPAPPGPPDPNAPKPTYDFAPANTPLTVRYLVTMTSGLQTIGVPNDQIPPVGPDDTLATRVPNMADAPLDFQPGTKWHYSNATGFDVLGYIVEVVSGQRLGEFIQQRILGPLGMNETTFGMPKDAGPRLLTGPQGPLSRGTYESGSAGLYSTCLDYSKFAQMLLQRGLADGARILKEETIAEMTTNQVGDKFSGVTPREYAGRTSAGKGVGYGLGFGIVTDANKSNRGVPTGSFGWDGIGSRRFWVMPSLDTVLVMLALGPNSDAAQIDIERAVANS